MSKLITLAGIVGIMIAAFGSAGCNTMRGFGKDVERGGERVQDAAKPKSGSTQPAK